MHASRFNAEAENLSLLEDNPYIAFEKEFLRWMLSDGAAAALLQPEPAKSGISLKIEWIELTSFAGELESCMYGGAVKGEDGRLTGWNELTPADWTTQSIFSLKQDTRLLSSNIVALGSTFLKKLMEKYSIGSDDVDYFLPHMSSEFFKKPIQDHLATVGMHLPDEKWFYNLTRVGNVGAASVFLMLEEFVRTADLKKGQKILVMVPESARFTYAYLYLTVA
jgi:3-oxoacyl-[acyl-carrier-protein] synthase-3